MSDFRDKQDIDKRAWDKFKLMQYEEAIKDFDEAIRLNPNEYFIYCHRGQAKVLLKQYDEAIKDYNEAIRLSPNHHKLYIQRGSSKALLKQYDEAIKDFDKAIQLNPSDYNVYYNRGGSKALLKQYDEAIKDFDEAIQLNPSDYNVYYNRGSSKALLKQYDEAIKDFDEAIRLNPDNTSLLIGRLSIINEKLIADNKQIQENFYTKVKEERDAYFDKTDIANEYLEATKRYRRTYQLWFFWSILLTGFIVVASAYLTDLDLDMSLTQHLNLYVTLLPFIFFDFYFILQARKSSNLLTYYDHKFIVTKSLLGVRNEFFKLKDNAELLGTEEYKEYRKFGLAQYEFLFRSLPDAKEDLKINSIEVNKSGIKVGGSSK
jgi:tetratricopeptide (TPR) repeat protein